MIDIQFVMLGNAGAIVAGVFFMRMWVNGVNTTLKEISAKLDDKVSDKLCCERRKVLKEDISKLEGNVK